MKAVAWGRLLRLSLAPSAVADALAGITIGAWGAFPLDPRAALLPIASLCVFHGGMALNDWADRAGDARTRRERPIPSGEVAATSALRAAIALLLIGPLLAAAASPPAGALLAGTAMIAAIYDLSGRGPWIGPALLALCRAMNLGAGVLAGTTLARQEVPGVPRWALAACLLYGAYVFNASRLARLEDDEDPRPLARRPARALAAASACLLLLPLVPWIIRQPWNPSPVAGRLGLGVGTLYVALTFLLPALALAAAGAFALIRTATATRSWTRSQVGAATGMALRRLLVFTAICAWISAVPRAQATLQDSRNGLPAVLVSAVLLAGYPLAVRLRRVFPPT